VKANLSVNCRNLEVIGKLTNTLVPKSAKWKYFKRTENQVDPYIDFLSKDANFIEIIDRAIEYFRNQKFSFDDIIFLTPSAIENPSEVFQESKFASKFTKFDTNSVGKIGFSTIHAIKGLESPCVALIELYELKNMPEKSTLFYVALTRATDRLYIAADPESKKVIEEISNEK
jgi:ATP-dependent exoDNAse (exonuclease V) beta subunit